MAPRVLVAVLASGPPPPSVVLTLVTHRLASVAWSKPGPPQKTKPRRRSYDRLVAGHRL